MSDVFTQLRAYFDEVTERMTEEDIRMRATTARGVRTPPVRFRPRPLAAGAIGFGLAMTLVGAVLVMNRVFGGTADVGAGGGSGFNGAGSPWVVIPVVVGAGLLAAGIIATLQNTRIKSKGGRTMQTIEREEPTVEDSQLFHLKKRNRLFVWLSGFLALAVIGLGAWLAMELTGSDGASLPSEVEAALDDYIAAWDTSDGVAFMAATTPDYTFRSNGATFSQSQQAGAVGLADNMGFSVEQGDERIVIGDGPYYVAQTARVHALPSPPEGDPGQSIFTIALHDGSWKVQQHTWVGDF